MKEQATMQLPFGAISIVLKQDVLESISFLAQHRLPEGTDGPRSSAMREVMQQLTAYLHDPRSPFTVRYRASGTPFQQRVWQLIAEIPPGETRRYGELAHALCSSPRAVGGACGRNPLPLVIPCHRVLAATGLGGFNQSMSQDTQHIKQWLLQHERRHSLS